MLCCIALLLLLSLLYIRRAFYEAFVILHYLLSLALVVLLWLHVPMQFTLPFICLACGSALWILQNLARASQFVYHRLRGQAEAGCTITCPSTSKDSMDAMIVHLELSRPIKVKHGQHVLISVPSTQSFFGRLQSHPYLIAWSDHGREQASRTIDLLIQRRNGFSNRLGLHKNASAKTFIRGPYGRGARLNDFDKALFVASGIGIAAHLVAIRHLLQAHEERTARVRRISLLWFLEKPGKLFHFPIDRALISSQIRSFGHWNTCTSL